MVLLIYISHISWMLYNNVQSDMTRPDETLNGIEVVLDGDTKPILFSYLL